MQANDNGAVAEPHELAEYMQTLASGGSLNNMQYEALRAAFVERLHDPQSPMVVYTCRKVYGQGAHCGGELIQTNAPYGRAKLRCHRCRAYSTVYFGGYQHLARQVS